MKTVRLHWVIITACFVCFAPSRQASSLNSNTGNDAHPTKPFSLHRANHQSNDSNPKLNILSSLPCFEPERVVVQEVEVDEEVEPGLRCERVVEERGDGPPQVELVEEVLPHEDQPLRAEQAEPAEQGEEDGKAEPVPRKDRQGLEPILKIFFGLQEIE